MVGKVEEHPFTIFTQFQARSWLHFEDKRNNNNSIFFSISCRSLYNLFSFQIFSPELSFQAPDLGSILSPRPQQISRRSSISTLELWMLLYKCCYSVCVVLVVAICKLLILLQISKTNSLGVAHCRQRQ